MKKLALLTLAFTVIGLAVLAQPTTVSADDDDKHDKPTTQAQKPETYAYTAQVDDSYTVLARKAIQTYGFENKVNLSAAQIVFAETNITIEAGSLTLSQNQKVEIKKDTVKTWVEKAQKLGDADKKSWQYYVQFVDFDTRDNGEAKKA